MELTNPKSINSVDIIDILHIVVVSNNEDIVKSLKMLIDIISHSWRGNGGMLVMLMIEQIPTVKQ